MDNIDKVDNIEEELKEILKQTFEVISHTDKLIRSHKLENSQEFLDWQDKLNALSVK